MSDPDERIVRLEDKVSHVENEMSTLREHIDERMDSGRERMNEMAVDIKKLDSTLTTMGHVMAETQKDLLHYKDIDQAQRQTLLDKIDAIHSDTKKVAEFFAKVGEIKPTDMRANHDWTIKAREYGNRAIIILIGLGVVSLVGFILKQGVNVGP